MIEAKDLRVNIIITDHFGEQVAIDEDRMEVLMATRGWEDLTGIQITKEILKNNFGFTIHDLGDFWQCELDAFVLIQPKLQILDTEMPFIFGYKTMEAKTVTFSEVHLLQNFYYQIEQKELLWNK